MAASTVALALLERWKQSVETSHASASSSSHFPPSVSLKKSVVLSWCGVRAGSARYSCETADNAAVWPFRNLSLACCLQFAFQVTYLWTSCDTSQRLLPHTTPIHRFRSWPRAVSSAGSLQLNYCVQGTSSSDCATSPLFYSLRPCLSFCCLGSDSGVSWVECLLRVDCTPCLARISTAAWNGCFEPSSCAAGFATTAISFARWRVLDAAEIAAAHRRTAIQSALYPNCSASSPCRRLVGSCGNPSDHRSSSETFSSQTCTPDYFWCYQIREAQSWTWLISVTLRFECPSFDAWVAKAGPRRRSNRFDSR